jgi:hypothetical protein
MKTKKSKPVVVVACSLISGVVKDFFMNLTEKKILTTAIFHILQEKADMLFPPAEVEFIFVVLILSCIISR